MSVIQYIYAHNVTISDGVNRCMKNICLSHHDMSSGVADHWHNVNVYVNVSYLDEHMVMKPKNRVPVGARLVSVLTTKKKNKQE